MAFLTSLVTFLTLLVLLALDSLLAFNPKLTHSEAFAVFGAVGWIALVASRFVPVGARRPLFTLGASVQAGLCFAQQFEIWRRHGLYDITAFLVLGGLSFSCLWVLAPRSGHPSHRRGMDV